MPQDKDENHIENTGKKTSFLRPYHIPARDAGGRNRWLAIKNVKRARRQLQVQVGFGFLFWAVPAGGGVHVWNASYHNNQHSKIPPPWVYESKSINVYK